MLKILKSFKTFIVILIILIFIVMIFTIGKIYDKSELEYGVTFSQKHSTSLKLNWKSNFISILDDLKVKKLRLIAYWDIIESQNNSFDYSDLDWQIKEAQKREADVVLAVGMRLPRWPECHSPSWTKNLEKEKKQKEILEYIEKTIIRYRDYENIKFWQIENEPFLLDFGNCPGLDVEFLDKEIALVKSISDKPIIITDSGELSLWIQAAKRSTVFGTSLYLNTFSSRLNRYVHYPITPKFFHFKINMTKIFTRPEEFIVIELQAEPWGQIPYQYMDDDEKAITMDIEKFKKIIDFSHKSGFKTFYFWGAEFWYWEKEVNNNPIFWEEAKKLFNN